MKLYLEPRFLKIQHLRPLYCKNPQYNEKCTGKFLKTRVRQVECVECMKLHGTIDKHPLLVKVQAKKIMYSYHGVTAEDYVFAIL